MLLAIVLVAWFGGVYPALVTAAVGALATDYYLLQPRHTFAVHGKHELAGVGMYLAVASGSPACRAMRVAQQRRRPAPMPWGSKRRSWIKAMTRACLGLERADHPVERGAERLYGFSRTEALDR